MNARMRRLVTIVVLVGLVGSLLVAAIIGL
jgi:hypothetical protein